MNGKQHAMTRQDVRDAYVAGGYTHAEFCVEQAESQAGREAMTDARDELRKIELEDAADDRDQINATR